MAGRGALLVSALLLAVAAVTTPAPPPGGETPELTPAWQTSAPREPVAIGEGVKLGIRNENDEPGECYDFTMEVRDPLGWYLAFGTVCANEWADLSYWNTSLYGTYDVFFSIQDQDIAQDSFDVAEW